MTAKTLVPILGDQLSHTIASLDGCDKADTVVLMMEVWEETTYVRHHKQKIVLILSAMRHFAAELEAQGWQVDYIRLDDTGNTGSFTGEVGRAIQRHGPERIRIVEPGEWRVLQAIDSWDGAFGVPVEIMLDTRFLSPLPDFFAWAQGRKRLLMENFYRDMRAKTGLLMEGGPAGGQWNYDKDNRAPPPKHLDPPEPPRFVPDAITREVIDLVAAHFPKHFGQLEPFGWPVTADQAEQMLDAFIADRLPQFGTYQDVMIFGSDALFHSQVSTSLNLGLLDPLAICRRAEQAWRDGTAPLNAVEGFIRQIIGWREYIRGMYWLEMPALREANALDATLPLPEFYWTAETDMRCLHDCVRSTRDNAHAHHIQRLMVLGNFALIAGVRPQELEDWFLVVYADAYEWVELPNVAAMALWADHGRMASKPYAASGAYINRMSDYCRKCRYDVREKTGPDACPFNALYWDFLDRNAKTLAGSSRLTNPYATWGRMSEKRRAEYKQSAASFLATLEPAQPGWAR